MLNLNLRLPLALPLVVAAALFGSGCILNLDLGPRAGQLTQHTVRPAENFFDAGKILLVDVSGVLLADTSPSFFDGPDTVTLVTESLERAAKDPEIKAVVLRINSPGGGVTTSDILYNEVMRFRAERDDVRVYASMLDLAASGGYYVASAAHEILAHPTTITGSIGVIAEFPQIKGLTTMLGLRMRTIKSGANKDIGSPFEDMTDEQATILQATIDDMYERFLDVVSKGRPNLDKERIRALADGRIYTANQALENGLIDSIEYLPKTIERIEELAGGSMTIVAYDPALAPGTSLYATRSRASSASASANRAAHDSVVGEVGQRLGLASSSDLPTGFYYIWME